MVLSRIGDLISAASARWSSHSSSSSSSSSSELLPTRDSGLLPPRDYDLGLGFPNKNNLRLSSSLQDLSTYQKLGQFHSSLYTSQPSFSKEKPSPAPPGSPYSARKKFFRTLLLFLCLLLLAFLVYLLAVFISSYWSRGASKFYVVLDCGSTGTRVYVYQASLYHHSHRSLPIVIKSLTPESLHRKPSSQSGRAYHRMETEPGFHKLVHNISGLKSAIKPLVRWAAKQIPHHAHETTSVFLYATAGVRRLPSTDSKWLLDNAWSILNSSPFLCRREWVKIISGMEEAYFGWIALNHLKGMLGAKPRMPTFGALDLGGSSLQVTFESESHDQSESNLNLRIGNANHHLTAYSLSGYGLNDAFDKSVVHLFKRLPENIKADLLSGKVQIKHPCLQTGYKEQYTCSQCASKYQQGKTLDVGGKLGTRVTLIGAPNWDECSALAKRTVNLSEWSNVSSGINCDLQPCALGDGFPRPNGKFYALSGFFVVYRFFNLTSDAALDNVLEKGRGFCERTWEAAKNSVAPQPFIEQYCFRAPYIVSLLREGLHIEDSKITIGSGGITWTLGVALLEAGNAFSTRMGIHNYELLQMEINPFLLLIVLFISLFLLLCALSCAGNWRPKFLRRLYLPLFRHNNASSVSVLGMSSPFRLQRWSPMSSGDGRAKMPLSPTIGGSQQRAFGFGAGVGNNGEIQLMESSLCPSTSSVAHSYSSTNLGQMQFDNGSMASFWSPHRSQMRLQSRRSQSREDLSSSFAEAHMVKV